MTDANRRFLSLKSREHETGSPLTRSPRLTPTWEPLRGQTSEATDSTEAADFTSNAACEMLLQLGDLVDIRPPVEQQGLQLPSKIPLSPEPGANEDAETEDPVMNFWRGFRSVSHVPTQLSTSHKFDYFVSHAWLPSTDEACERQHIDYYVREKTEALHQYGKSEAVLGDSGNAGALKPWFLLASDEKRTAEKDPKDCWRSRLCWIDKVSCKSQRSAEAVSTTRDALCRCRKFLAVFTSHFLARLWCILELSTYLVYAAPHYRCLELVIHESRTTPKAWQELVTSASSFSLANLQTGNQVDHQELWRNLERLILSTSSFERFIQATTLACLARHALLLCSRNCAAFGKVSELMPDPAKRLENVVDACSGLGLHGLARAIRSARPKHWWQLGLRKARDADESREKNSGDVLEKICQVINAKLDAPYERKDPLREQTESDSRRAGLLAMVLAQNEDVKKKANMVTLVKPVLQKLGGSPYVSEIAMDQEEPTELLHPPSSPEQLTPPPSHKSDAKSQTSQPLCRPSSALLKPPSRPPSRAPSPEEIQEHREITNSLLPQPGETFSSTLPRPAADSYLKRAPVGVWSTAEGKYEWEKDTKVIEETKETAKDLTNVHEKFSHVLIGIPDGFDPFWRAVNGGLISEEERCDAQVFRDAWSHYRQYVDKWFDKYVCPHLEVWRLRGIRGRGVLEEVLGTSLRSVGGSLLNALCDKLAPGAREAATRGRLSMSSWITEASFRGRPRQTSWTNPTLDRLVVMSNLQHLVATGDGTSAESVKKVAAEKPAIYQSPLPLEKGVVNQQTLISISSKKEELMQTVQVPQRLGVDALVNAVLQMLRGFSTTSLEMTILCPRLAFKVRGAQFVRVNVGLRVEGTLRPALPSVPKSMSQSIADSQSVLAHAESTTILDKSVLAHAESSTTLDMSVYESIDWHRWSKSVHTQEKGEATSDNVNVETSANIVPKDRRARILTALYVSADPQDPSKPFLSPRKTRATNLIPLPSDALQKAWKHMGLPDGVSLDASPGAYHKSGRYAGPGGLLPSTAVESNSVVVEAAKRKAGLMPVISPKTDEKVLTPLHFHAANVAHHAETVARLANRTSKWEWTVRIDGGSAWKPSDQSWSGTVQDMLEQYDTWQHEVRHSGSYFDSIPIDDTALACKSEFNEDKSRMGGALCPEATARRIQRQLRRKTIVDKGLLPAPLARSLPCPKCNQTDTALVSLDHSMLKAIWTANECSICLVCGHTIALEMPLKHGARPTTIDGDTVLEVNTNVLLLPGAAENFQHLVTRVLRVNHGQVLVAADPGDHKAEAPTRSRSRVGHLSFCTRTAGIVAAATSTHRANQGIGQFTRGNVCPFSQNLSWCQSVLGDTGLDLFYGADQHVPLDGAIGDLDDQRTLPRRNNVSALVLWAELRYILSPDFDPDVWIRACVVVLGNGNFSLPGAILLRNNLEKLRKAVADASPPLIGQDLCRDEPVDWPLALHRVLVTRYEHSDIVLGSALRHAGIGSNSPAELLSEGSAALAKKCETESGSAEKQQEMRKAQDARGVMHDLLYRRRTLQSDAANRAMLRARRTLRQMQVYKFLSAMQERVSRGDHALDKLFDENGSADVSDDEDADLVSDGDEKSSSSESDEGRDQHIESLLVQKILGHAREYLDHVDILQKALQVLCVIVQTCSRITLSLETHQLAMRNLAGVKMSPIRNVERLLLDQGFSRVALRTIYRHSKRPSICIEVYMMLEHLINPAGGHPCAERARLELSTPPLNFFTIVIATGIFSKNGQLDILMRSLRLLNALGNEESVKEPPPLPEGRESEAANALIPVCQDHSDKKDIFTLVLQLLFGLARNTTTCHALFHGQLTQVLRDWLSQSAEGVPTDTWRRSLEAEDPHPHCGATGKGARLFRDKATKIAAVPEQVSKCDRLAWDTILRLSNGSEKEEKFLKDTGLTIEYCLEVIKRLPRIDQWELAVNCMNDLIRSNWTAHTGRFVSLGGLEAICRDIPNGKMSQVLPLLVATIGAASPLAAAEVQPGDPEHAHSPTSSTGQANNLEQPDFKKQVSRQSFSSHKHKVVVGGKLDVYLSSGSHSEDEEVQERKWHPRKYTSKSSLKATRHLKSTAAVQQVASKMDGIVNAAQMEANVLVEKSRDWMVENKVVDGLLEGLEMCRFDVECQVHLLRVLGELFKCSKAKDAVAQFEHFGEDHAEGLKKVLATLKQYVGNNRVVNVCLFTLLGAFDISFQLTETAGNLPNTVTLLLDTLWTHILEPQARRRALKAVRWIREGVPALTTEISILWEERRAKFLDRKEVKARLERSKTAGLGTSKVGGVCDCGQVHDVLLDDSDDDGEVTRPSAGSRKLKGSTTLAVMPDLDDIQEMHAKRSKVAMEEEIKVATKTAETIKEAGRKFLNKSATMKSRRGNSNDKWETPKSCASGQSVEKSFFMRRAALKCNCQSSVRAQMKLSEDVELYRSVLRVHRYLLLQGNLPLVEATEPLNLHTWDREVVIVALAGLISGSKTEFESRCKEVARDVEFPIACKKAVLNFPEPDVFMPALKISHGVMLASTDHHLDKSAFLEAAAVAARAALDVLLVALKTKRKCWATEETWGAFLETIDCALRQRNGKDTFEEHRILDLMEEAWRHFEDSESEPHRLLVKSHKGGTEYVLAALGREAGSEEGEEESDEQDEDSEEEQGEEGEEEEDEHSHDEEIAEDDALEQDA